MEKDLLNLQEIDEVSKKTPKPKRLIIIASIAAVVILSLCIGLPLGLKKKSNSSLKNIDIVTLQLSPEVIIDNAYYLSTGRVFLLYNKQDSNKTYFGIIDDDGKNFKELYGEEIQSIPKNNGIRTLPFFDNKRVFLGDYIFECSDNLNTCSNPQLILVKYPQILYDTKSVFKRWSEPIVSQDNSHVAWTTLDIYKGSVNFIGKILKHENNTESNQNDGNETYYYFEDVKIISNDMMENFDNETKIFTPGPIRGGELKQFVKGGKAITEAGSSGSGLGKPIYQELDSYEVHAVSNKPGYEETCIFSPDEKLGLVMSTRFSNESNLAIVGLLYLPHSILCSSSIMGAAYTFSITQVRKSRKGNIGPALIELDKSLKDKDYMGINLNKDSDWNFKSPMSWHYSSKKVMFMEVRKNSEDSRVRIAHLKDYKPNKAVANSTVPDNIPYAKNIETFKEEPLDEYEGKIKGQVGNITFYKNLSYTEMNYNNFSEDGKTFYNGNIIYIKKGMFLAGIYKCDVVAKGNENGNCDFQLTFDDSGNLDYEKDTEGNKKTRGTCTYKNTTIDAEIYNHEKI